MIKSFCTSYDSGKGFTLLELIVALFMISLIAAIVLPSFAGFGDRKLQSDAREVSSILRLAYDSAVTRKETYWVKFDLNGNLISWKAPEGTRTKTFNNMTGVTIQSKGRVTRGAITVFVEPLGPKENLSVHMGREHENMTITLNHLSGRVKIEEKL